MKILSLIIAASIMDNGLLMAHEELPQAELIYEKISSADELSVPSMILSELYELKDDDSGEVVLSFYMFYDMPDQAFLTLRFREDSVCYDNASELEVTFADGNQKKYPSVGGVRCDSLMVFLVNAKEFPLNQITAMKVERHLDGKHHNSKFVEKSMTQQISDFIQAVLWEIHWIHQGEMIAPPTSDFRHPFDPANRSLFLKDNSASEMTTSP